MCFSLAWFQQLLIMVVVVAAVVAILKLLVPWVLAKAGAEIGDGVAMLMSVLRIVIWAVVVIFVIYICFALIQCLMSYGGGMPLFPRAR